jgi:hypothetical protein
VQDSSLLESEREFDIDMQLADAKKRPSWRWSFLYCIWSNATPCLKSSPSRSLQSTRVNEEAAVNFTKVPTASVFTSITKWEEKTTEKRKLFFFLLRHTSDQNNLT